MRTFCAVLFLFFYTAVWLLAQDIIDIKIDSIHCQDGSCFLLNISEDDVYDCEIVSHELGTDRYSYAIDCSRGGPGSKSDAKENSLDLQKIEDFEYNGYIQNAYELGKLDEDEERPFKLNVGGDYRYKERDFK